MAFALYKGIEWNRVWTSTDDATGERTDLTDKTIVVQVRRVASGAVLIQLEVGDGVELRDQNEPETKGQAEVTIAAELSEGLDVGSHRISVLLDGDVVTPPTKLPVRAL